MANGSGQSHSGHSASGQLGPEQRRSLLKAKLAALVRDLVGDAGPATKAEPEVRGSLTGVAVPGSPGFVLSDFGTPAAVAGAMSWALKSGSSSMTLFVDFDAEAAARFAGYFTRSESDGGGFSADVRVVSGSTSVSVAPEPIPAGLDAPETPVELLDLLRSEDLEIVAEHGVVRGEVLGLEVARLVVWPLEAGGDGRLHLEVGVGRFDRDAVWAVNDGQNMTRALRDTVEVVRRNRYPGAPPHPLQRLNRERWLRSTIVRNPEVVGARELSPVGMTVEAAGMKDAHTAGARGSDPSGRPLVVVSSVGVDLSAVPLAADLRASIDPAAGLVLAVPATDLHPTQLKLASMLEPPATVVPVQVEWN